MRFVGALLAFLAMVAFAFATFFEVRDFGFTTHAWAYLGLLLLAIPTGISAFSAITGVGDGQPGVGPRL